MRSLLLLLLLVAGTTALLVAIRPTRDGPQPQTPPATAAGAREDVFGFDPDANPFLATSPTFLGLPLTGPAAIVLDATQTRQNWMPTIRAVLRRLRSTPRSKEPCVVYLATEDGPRRLGDSLYALEDQHLRELKEGGLAPIAPTVQAAIEAGLNHIILVTGRLVFSGELAALAKALDQGDGRIMLRALEINNAGDPALSELAKRYGGTSRRLSTHRIEQWLVHAP